MTDSFNDPSSIAINANDIKKLQAEVEKLSEKSDNRKDDVEKLWTGLRAESFDRKLEQSGVLHAVEENNVNLKHLTKAVEQVIEGQRSMKEDQEVMKVDISYLKDNSFNIGKFFSGCMSPKGFVLIVTICTTISVVSLSVFAPDTLPDFFKSVHKTSK